MKSGDIEILPVRGNVYMLIGAGGNITVHAGNEEVLLVDAGLESMSDKVLAAVRSISKRPINTSSTRASTTSTPAVTRSSPRPGARFRSVLP